jgi:hypothetical protein
VEGVAPSHSHAPILVSQQVTRARVQPHLPRGSEGCSRRGVVTIASPALLLQILVSLLQACRSNADSAVAGVLADYYVSSWVALKRQGNTRTAADVGAFPEPYLRFCVLSNDDAAARDFLQRLLAVDPADATLGQLFGQYFGFVFDAKTVEQTLKAVDVFAAGDFDGWPWVWTMRRLGVTGAGSRRVPFQAPIALHLDMEATAVLRLLQRVFDVASGVISASTPKSAEAPVWDTLVDAYVMSLTRHVCRRVLRCAAAALLCNCFCDATHSPVCHVVWGCVW